MADSAQSRMTVLEVPGLMMTPLPHGSESAADRAQLDDIYSGILAKPPMFQNMTCWVNEQEEQQIWVPEIEIVPCDD
jgi:hypothetical protein